MKLGIIAGDLPAMMSVPIDLVRDTEAMAYASVWTAEAYGSDAVSLAAWKDAGRKRHVGSLLAGTGDIRALRILAEEIL